MQNGLGCQGSNTENHRKCVSVSFPHHSWCYLISFWLLQRNRNKTKKIMVLEQPSFIALYVTMRQCQCAIAIALMLAMFLYILDYENETENCVLSVNQGQLLNE